MVYRKKSQYPRNFFKNWYIQNLRLSENKTLIFNFSKNKIPKKVFMNGKDWNFCDHISQALAILEKNFFIFIFFIFGSSFSWNIFHFKILPGRGFSITPNLSFYKKIFKKLWWFAKLVQWIKNRTFRLCSNISWHTTSRYGNSLKIFWILILILL